MLGKHPRVFPPSLQGRWLRSLHLLLTQHAELLPWQHTPIQKGMGTSPCLTREEAAPWYFEWGRRREQARLSAWELREADLDLHNTQVCVLLPPARGVQWSATSALLLVVRKHARGDGDMAPTPHQEPTRKQG